MSVGGSKMARRCIDPPGCAHAALRASNGANSVPHERRAEPPSVRRPTPTRTQGSRRAYSHSGCLSHARVVFARCCCAVVVESPTPPSSSVRRAPAGGVLLSSLRSSFQVRCASRSRRRWRRVQAAPVRLRSAAQSRHDAPSSHASQSGHTHDEHHRHDHSGRRRRGEQKEVVKGKLRHATGAKVTAVHFVLDRA